MTLFNMTELNKYPDLTAFLTADNTANLMNLAWHLESGYFLTLIDKGSHRLPLASITAAMGLVDHLKTLIQMNDIKPELKIDVADTFRASIRCGQSGVVNYLMESFPLVLMNAKVLYSATQVSI